MDQKTKSMLIGVGSAFAAVLVIVLLFFSISGIGSASGDSKSAKGSKGGDVQVVSVDSDGNTVVMFDDDDDDDNASSASSEAEATSSEEAAKQTIKPFGRSDIDGITDGISTFAQFVSAVSPVSYEWSAQKMGATGEVTVKLIAADGSYAVIGVPYESDDYTVDGETNGLGIDVTDWTVYDKSKKEECRVTEIVWLSNKMKFTLPRGVKIGTAYADITAAYYKLENPEKSYLLYDFADVVSDAAKQKAYKNAKSAYVGGKIYKTTTLLDYYYKDNNDAYPFATTSKNVIRYGFNSIVDTTETSGQWYIEYATMNSKVMGVYFHMSGADD